jgi:hypothetical protein
VRNKPKSDKRASMGTTGNRSSTIDNSSSDWITEGAGSDCGEDGEGLDCDGEGLDCDGEGEDSSSKGERRSGWMKRRRERSFLNARLQRGMHELKPVRTLHWCVWFFPLQSMIT